MDNITKKYSIVFNLLIAILIAFIGLLISNFFLRGLILIGALIFFGKNFIRLKTLYYTLIISFVIVPFFIAISINPLIKPFSNIKNFNWFIYSNTEVLKPDKYIEGSKNLEIKCTSVEIKFDDTTEKLYIPSKIKVLKVGNTTKLEYKKINSKIIITIGTKNKYSSFKLNTVHSNLNGNLNSDKIEINDVHMELNSTLKADSIILKGVHSELSGSIISKNLLVSCVHLEIYSTLNSNDIKINGTSIKFNSVIERGDNLYINGTSINAKINYTKPWENAYHLNINGTSGNIVINEPKDNTGNLIIESSGSLSIKRNSNVY
ncbi:hypothetical protein OSSY52_00960 [Tepiditoga spiralis]|uniref:Adhesin domain-containing protein n=1 Tax=Tepiditoga spiralis TaxID=2108365 RepID=A0A7G1G268_9BACT|nr:hypothetical protein [Tepiditoga spiralis]BBE29955.1 hypothetical protein OSSY52_00960 [Tepiditoga spiralis]